MLWSKTFIPTLKENPQEAESASHQLMLKSGLIRMLMAGVYSYLPLGLKVLNNIERIIRQEMDAAGAAILKKLRRLLQETGQEAAFLRVVVFRFPFEWDDVIVLEHVPGPDAGVRRKAGVSG